MADTAIDPGPGLPMSRTDYRRWAGAQLSGRFERIDGLVVAMAPERLSNVGRKSLVWLALRRAVAAAGVPCHVYGDGATVEVDDNDFEPDAVLRCGDKLPGDGVSVPDPIVVVEVLSPSPRQAQDSPHFHTTPKVSASSGTSASIEANRSINGTNRCSGMVGMRS